MHILSVFYERTGKGKSSDSSPNNTCSLKELTTSSLSLFSLAFSPHSPLTTSDFPGLCTHSHTGNTWISPQLCVGATPHAHSPCLPFLQCSCYDVLMRWKLRPSLEFMLLQLCLSIVSHHFQRCVVCILCESLRIVRSSIVLQSLPLLIVTTCHVQ